MTFPPLDPDILAQYNRNGIGGGVGAATRKLTNSLGASTYAVNNALTAPFRAGVQFGGDMYNGMNPPNLTVPPTLPQMPTPNFANAPTMASFSDSTRNAVNGPTGNPNGTGFVPSAGAAAAPQAVDPNAPQPQAPITRYDVPGQVPLYSNVPFNNTSKFAGPVGERTIVDGSGNPVSNNGGTVSSVSMNGGARAAPDTTFGVPAGTINALAGAAAAPYDPHDILANLGARQSARQLSRIVSSSTDLQNAASNAQNAATNVQHQRAEIPLANLNAQITARGQNFGLAPHLPAMSLQQMGLHAIQNGDLDTGQDYFRAATGAYPRIPRNPLEPFTQATSPDGDTVLQYNKYTGGPPAVYSIKALQEKQRLQAAQAAADAAVAAKR